MLATIPSPHSGAVEIGPLTLRLYGITLLVAIAACVWLTGVRWVRRGGDWDLVFRVAVWGVAAGIVGARAYHVLTSWSEVPDPKWKGVFEVWEGGLGVWGGIFLGTVVGAIVVRRSGASVLAFMDAVAPGLLLAQGIGRIGNWWNQELYGKPTDLPWALEIDQAHSQQYPPGTTFHPTFLYELLWDLGMVGVLLLLDRRYRFRPPALFSLYVAFYCFGRFFEELLRVDPAHHFWGMRLNGWVALLLFTASSLFFIWWQLYGAPRPRLRLRRRKAEEKRQRAMAVPRGRVRPAR